MNNKQTIPCFIFLMAALFSCRTNVKNEAQTNTTSADHSSHNDNAQMVAVDTSQSVVTWQGSMLIGANSHTGNVYISRGDLMIDSGNITGGTVVVDMNTIEDESHGRDNNLVNHLKDPDFFDVKKFPVATIAITGVSTLNDQQKQVAGNLTIKGITNPVIFPVTVEVKDSILKANGKLVIDRTKWDVRYKSGKFYDLLADQTMSDSIRFDIKIVTSKLQ